MSRYAGRAFTLGYRPPRFAYFQSPRHRAISFTDPLRFATIPGQLLDRRRAATAVGVAAGHLALLWLVLHLSGLVGPQAPPDRALTTVEIADVPAPSAPARPAPVPPIPVLNPPVLLPSAVKVAAAAAASGNGAGAGCGMAGVIGRAIAADPAAMAALAALPAGVRTEADAVMLWNGGWIDVGGAPISAQSALPAAVTASATASAKMAAPRSPPRPSLLASLLPQFLQSDPLAPLKQTVVTALAAAPPECSALGVAGPQLIPIAEPSRTTMLVIGSGMWKWTDLIDPAVMSPDDAVAASGLPAMTGLAGPAIAPPPR